jgi:hypothetical protein
MRASGYLLLRHHDVYLLPSASWMLGHPDMSVSQIYDPTASSKRMLDMAPMVYFYPFQEHSERARSVTQETAICGSCAVVD